MSTSSNHRVFSLDETDAHLRPVYAIHHQHVCLQVDFSTSSVVGFTELELSPIGVPFLTILPVHARQVHVSHVTLNGVEVDYEYYNYLESFPTAGDLSIAALDVTWRASCAYSNTGELLVRVPEKGLPKHPPRSAYSAFCAALDPPVRPSPPYSATYALRIYYELVGPLGGLRFSDGALYAEKQPMCARMWLPTVDFPYQGHPWSLELVVPHDCIAVCSGDLLEQLITADGTQRVCKYLLKRPTAASDLGLVVGRFSPLVDPAHNFITCFASSAMQRQLASFVADPFLARALAFLEDHLGRFPFSSLKLAFVPCSSAAEKLSVFHSLLVLDASLLHTPQHVEPVYALRRAVALGLVRQWLGVALSPETHSDGWLFEGLSRYMEHVLFAHVMGNNEASFQAYTLSKEIVEENTRLINDNLPLYPLYHPTYIYPTQLQTPFYQNKAFLVILMLFRRFGEENTRELLVRILSKDFIPSSSSSSSSTSTSSSSTSSSSSLNSTSTNAHSLRASLRASRKKHKKSQTSSNTPRLNTLTTAKFFKHAAAFDRPQDLRNFQSQWVYGTSVLVLRAGYMYNKKKNQLEIALKQSHPNCDTKLNLFLGRVKLRVTELDASYDYAVDMEDTHLLLEVPVHNRVRRNQNRTVSYTYLNGQEIQVDNISSDIPLLWVKVDTDFDWPLAHIQLVQAETFWMLQLLLDRDVPSQLDAITAISKSMSARGSQTLEDVLQDECVFWRVRAHAAQMFCSPRYGSTTLNQLNLEKMLKIMRALFFSPSGVALPNDFSDLILYFLKMELVRALSRFAFSPNYPTGPFDVFSLLCQMLQQNDNAKSRVSDDFYLATLLRALAAIPLSDPTHADHVLGEYRTFLLREKVTPSFQNCIGVACIEGLHQLWAANHVALELSFFWAYTADSLGEPLRAAAYAVLVAVMEKRANSITAVLIEEGRQILSRLMHAVRSERRHPRIALHILAQMRQAMRPLSNALADGFMLASLWAVICSPAAAYNAHLRQAAYDLLCHFWPPTQQKERPVPQVAAAVRKQLEGLLPAGGLSVRMLQQHAKSAGTEVSSWEDDINAKIAKLGESIKPAARAGGGEGGDGYQVKSVAPGLLRLERSALVQSSGGAEILASPASQSRSNPSLDQSGKIVTPLRISALVFNNALKSGVSDPKLSASSSSIPVPESPSGSIPSITFRLNPPAPPPPP